MFCMVPEITPHTTVVLFYSHSMCVFYNIRYPSSWLASQMACKSHTSRKFDPRFDQISFLRSIKLVIV